MYKLISYEGSNWGSGCDTLDGKALFEGEKLEIVWPNDTCQIVKVVLRERHGTVSDMGQPWPYTYFEACVKAGQALISICNLPARRI